MLATMSSHAQSYVVSGTTFTGSGSTGSGVVDFLHSTPDFSFTTAAGANQFVGLNNFHTNQNGAADSYFLQSTMVAQNDIGVTLNGGATSPLSSFRISNLPTFNSGGNYGYDSLHTNGAIYNFGAATSVGFVSLIANGSNTTGNANVYIQNVNTAAAPEPAQLAIIPIFAVAVTALMVRRRQQLSV